MEFANLGDVNRKSGLGGIDHGIHAFSVSEVLCSALHVLHLFRAQRRLHKLLPAHRQEIQLLLGYKTTTHTLHNSADTLMPLYKLYLPFPPGLGAFVEPVGVPAVDGAFGGAGALDF